MHRPAHHHAFALALTLAAALTGCAGSQHAPQGDGGVSESPDTRRLHALHNFHALTPSLFSASEPGDEQAYAELGALGVRSVISVDAIPPNKALAERFGIRVAHIPITYERITPEQSAQLAHAIATLPRPILVNCHHGKHRGPAAICVGAVANGEITNDEAIAFMTRAQTSPDYPGLWDAARAARPLPPDQRLDPGTELPEAASVGTFTEGMGELSRIGELLDACADNAFRAPEDHPDLAPASLAGQMHNIFRAMEHDPVTLAHGDAFLGLLRASGELASTLETQIKENRIEEAYTTIGDLFASCGDCHDQFIKPW